MLLVNLLASSWTPLLNWAQFGEDSCFPGWECEDYNLSGVNGSANGKSCCELGL